MSLTRLAYLSEAETYGGAESFMIALLQLIDRDRYLPHYMGPERTPDRIREELDRLDVPFVPTPIIRGKADIRGLLEAKRQMASLNLDILHFNLSNPLHGRFGMLAARLAGIPIQFATMHLPPRETTATRRGRWLEQKTLGNLDRLIAVSEDSRNLVLNHLPLLPEQVVKVYNGIDPDAFDPKIEPPGTKHIGTVGRLAEQKGFRYLIEAFPRVVAAHPDVHLSIAGEGPLEEELKAQVASLGMQDSITFLGNRRDIPQLLSTFDLFVLPSIYESFPFTILEAMAAGRAVISTTVDGIPESIIEGETGLLDPSRSPEPLAEAILSLLPDPERCAQMGRAGRQRVQAHFTIQAMYDNVEPLYRECMAKKAAQ